MLDNDRFQRIRAQNPIRDYLASIRVPVDRSGMFRCVNPNGHDKNPSAKINNQDPDKWQCFGCGEHGDVIDLRALAEGTSLADAANAFDGGISRSGPASSKEPFTPKPKPRLHIVRGDYGQVPDDAPKPKDNKLEIWREDRNNPGQWISRDEQFSHAYEYRDRNNILQAYVIRSEFTGKDGQRKKKISPVRWNLTAKRFDLAGFIGREERPLYNHHKLVQNLKAEVLVVEGEKSAQVAEALFPDMVVVTWIGGTGQVRESDYSDLAQRHITLWADNDAPGFKAMAYVASQAKAATCLMVPMQESWGRAWDVEDIAGLGPGEATKALHTRKSYTPDVSPPGSAIGMWEKVSNGGWVPDYLQPILGTNGLVKADSVVNIELVLTHHPTFESLSWDVIRQCIVWQGKPIDLEQPLSFLAHLAGEKTRIVPTYGFDQAVETAARSRPVNPLADQIRALVWDGISRVEALWTYLGLGLNTDWNLCAPKRWFLGLVNRILHPGAQSDLMLVLEGPQGIGKSSALRILAEPFGFPGYVSISGFGSSATINAADMMVLSGKILCEMSEMSAHRRAEQDFFKGMLTRTEDRYRSPYGKRFRDVPRTATFAGTTNRRDPYLTDDSGGRRFAPVACVSQIDLGGLEQDREQIYAEAVHLLASGEEPFFNDEEEILQDAEIKQRTAVNLIRQEVEAYVSKWSDNVIQPDSIWTHLGVANAPLSERMRAKPLVDAAMAELGWVWSDRTLTQDGSRVRAWTRGERKLGRPPKPRPARPNWWPKN